MSKSPSSAEKLKSDMNSYCSIKESSACRKTPWVQVKKSFSFQSNEQDWQLQTYKAFEKYWQLMRSTWRIETMVLPELSRTMAYRTRKTVIRLERKQAVHLNHVALERPQEE